MGSDFNVGATSAQLWRGEWTDDGAGIGEWCHNSDTGYWSISAYTPEGESSNLIDLIDEGDRIQFTAVDTLRQIVLRVADPVADTNQVTFVAVRGVDARDIVIGTLTVASLVKGVSLDLVLTDEMGDALCDEDGNLIYEGN